MNKASVDGELIELNDFMSKIKDIALSDPKAYQYFLERTTKAQEALAALKDTSGIGKAEGEVLSEIGSLRFEFETYLTSGEFGENTYSNDIVPGIEKLKMYRVGVFVDMAKVFGAFDEVDIEKLRKLKEKWSKEKAKLSDTLGEDEEKSFKRRHVLFSYSEAEINLVEKALADLFIEYQIKYARKNNILPPESLYSFTDKAHYVERLKSKLVEKIYSMEQGSESRLNLEMAYLELKSEELMKKPEVWEALVGKKVLFPEREEQVEIKVQKPVEPLEPKIEEESLIDPSNVPTAGGYNVLLVYRGPNGVTDVRKKIKSTDENGRMRFLGLMGNKDVREIYFLEGLEKLRWTRNGNSNDGAFNYSDFDQVQSIYLPKSMKKIEQGFFLGFKNLKYIYLPEGMVSSLDPRLLPDGVKVVENPIRDQSKGPTFTSIVEDMEEEAVILTGDINTPIKRKFNKRGGLPEHLSIPCDYSKIKGLYFTNGTKTYLPCDIEEDGWESFYYTNFQLSNFSNLTRVSLPETFRDIAQDTFMNCKNLREINMPQNITYIPRKCFSGCESLQDIDLSNIEVIGEYAFYGCKGLKKLDFAEKLRAIREYAFSDCDGLTEVKLPVYLEKIGVDAFSECDFITKAEVPGNTKCIPSGLFKNCYNLQEVMLNRGIEEIRERAFEGCGRLKSLTIPYTVEYLGDSVFSSSGVRDVKFEGCNIGEKSRPLCFAHLKRVQFPEGSDYGRLSYLFVPGVDMEVCTYDEEGNIKPIPDEEKKRLLKLPDIHEGNKEQNKDEELNR
ncbi:MAG: leucine-rich repeat domain-containing protein [Clostridia bacterium]|nr:leucine-rich repeat domain-containing protein [Clostridia bacterium]